MFSRILVMWLGGIWKVKSKVGNSKVYRFIYNYYQFSHGSAISSNVYFENKALFPRGMKQIVIGDGVKIGKNCVIYHQVTIDRELLPNNSLDVAPRIGNNCYIYPGAKIIGDITIGNDVIISPNAVVQEDISNNSYV